MKFELIGRIENVEIIAVGRRIHDLAKLRKKHGRGRWRKLKGIGRVRLPDGFECDAELHWYEAHGIGRKEKEKSKSFSTRAMKTENQFAICVQNEGYPVSLELWKVYRIVPDKKAAQHNLVRVIDESGEDYLYDQGWFVPIKLPQAAKEAMLAASV